MPLNNTRRFSLKRTGSSLVFLWIGTLALLLVMLYNWRSDVKGAETVPENIFVDQLLLSSQDLQLGESANLINITLSRNSNNNLSGDSMINTSPQRRLVYSRILKSKINKIASAPVD